MVYLKNKWWLLTSRLVCQDATGLGWIIPFELLRPRTSSRARWDGLQWTLLQHSWAEGRAVDGNWRVGKCLVCDWIVVAVVGWWLIHVGPCKLDLKQRKRKLAAKILQFCWEAILKKKAVAGVVVKRSKLNNWTSHATKSTKFDGLFISALLQLTSENGQSVVPLQTIFDQHLNLQKLRIIKNSASGAFFSIYWRILPKSQHIAQFVVPRRSPKSTSSEALPPKTPMFPRGWGRTPAGRQRLSTRDSTIDSNVVYHRLCPPTMRTIFSSPKMSQEERSLAKHQPNTIHLNAMIKHHHKPLLTIISGDRPIRFTLLTRMDSYVGGYWLLLP